MTGTEFSNRRSRRLPDHVEIWHTLTPFLAEHHGCIDRVALDALSVDRGALARMVAERRLERSGLRVIEYTYEQVTQRGPWVRRQMRDRLTEAGWAA